MKHTQAVAPDQLSKASTYFSIFMIGLLFFIIGFTSWINSILIPYFKIACELTHFESYLVALAFYIAYFFMSVPSSMLLKKFGFKSGIMIGLFVMAAGALVFVPAAMARTYGIFLTGLFMIGTGLAVLQTAANPYITILGSKERAAQRISIMGICNKGAGIIAPLVFAAVVLKVSDSQMFELIESGAMSLADKNAALDELIQRVIFPYTILAAVLFVTGLIIRFSPLPEIDTDGDDSEKDASPAEKSKKTVWDYPHLILGAFAIFFHVGTQILAIDTVISYAMSMNLGLLEAKVFPAYILGATIVGYLIGIVLIPRFISQQKMFVYCSVLGLVLSVGILLLHGQVEFLGHTGDLSLWCLVALGLPNSLVWAGIWPLALDGVGRFTKLGSSLLIMGLCGNAVHPVLYGWIADMHNVRIAYIILIPFYLYLIFYSTYGYKMRRWSLNR